MALNLSHSSFVLFPYIKPASPYRTPPPSVIKQSRHFRQHDIYSDLEKLNAQQITAFLSSYQAFKHPIFGKQNPTKITNSFYQWVIKHNLSAWEIKSLIVDVNDRINGCEVPPLWCQARMGQSRTLLADGRIILIGGEYEDYYDPDFCLYNDISVINTDGTIETSNYPKAIFPPTDFHTATLVGTGSDAHILIVGSIGYINERCYNHTPVYRLNINNFKIEQVATRNSIGWIHKHSTVVKDNRLIVTNGKIITDETSPLIDNVNTWTLNLNTLIWKKLIHHDRNWQRFYVRRLDNNELHLWEYSRLNSDLFSNSFTEAEQWSNRISDAINKVPDLDSYRLLFIPPIDHEIFNVANSCEESIDYEQILFIDGIKVSYKNDDQCIQVIIEGKLSKDKLELLQQNLRHKLSKVENMACEVVDI